MIANNKVKLIGMTLVRVLTGVILFKFSLEMFSKDTISTIQAGCYYIFPLLPKGLWGKDPRWGGPALSWD
ncbi:MAG: hypothetical protein IPK94_24285 [Saprospiraceae bacterium]|nr:hypothetical protein [Saprospiraceae bacterium]